jgi:uncharacterized membrane protein
MTAPPTSEERQWAAVSYGGLIFYGLPSLIILACYRESPWIRFHALQSLGLGLLSLALGIALLFLNLIAGILGTFLGLAALGMSFAVAVGLLLYWITLTREAYQGKNVEILFLGPWIRKHLMDPPAPDLEKVLPPAGPHSHAPVDPVSEPPKSDSSASDAGTD